MPQKWSNSPFRVITDVMSVFEAYSFRAFGCSFLIWLSGCFYTRILVVMIYYYGLGRIESMFSFLISLMTDLVKDTKLGILGGSHVLLSTLFIVLLFTNELGLLPYCFRIRSHLVFSMSFGLSIWGGLVLSRLF